MNIRKIILEEINDFDWATSIEPRHEDYGVSLPSPESNTPFILVADVQEDLPCGPQDYMFRYGYRWSGSVPAIHGEPMVCHSNTGIHNSPYVLIPSKNEVNMDRHVHPGTRKFGMVGWLTRGTQTGITRHNFMAEHVQTENPRIFLWSNIVGKSPDFNFYDLI